MDEALLALIGELTLPVAAVIACIILWRDNLALRKALEVALTEHKTDLRDLNKGKVYELTARVMVMEDKLEIDRRERFDYMLPERAAELKALEDLDMKSERTYSDLKSERDKK